MSTTVKRIFTLFLVILAVCIALFVAEMIYFSSQEEKTETIVVKDVVVENGPEK